MRGSRQARVAWLWTVLLLAASPMTMAALPAADSQGAPLPTLAPMLERVTPAVVNIATRGTVRARDNPLMLDPFFRRFFGIPDRPQEQTTQSLGSGVVVDASNGYVITNNHVIDKADEITVTLRDGRSLAATLVGTDPEADIAVIQVPAQKLTALPIADSDKLQVGDFVVAIGNPFGLGQTVTSGIVSALGRTGLGIEGYEDFIQTDASINPGNSGGALVNLRGELVGVNTAILAPSGGNVGIGFAIPINMTMKLMEQIVAHGEVRRGVLGIAAQDLTPELATAFNLTDEQGAVIVRIAQDSQAERAGLQVGDVITALGGRKINSAAELRNAVGLMSVGERVEVVFLRDGQSRRATMVVEAPRWVAVPGEKLDRRLSGAVFQEIEPEEGGAAEGVLVREVVPGSAAAARGLRPGDLIVSINRRPVADIEELRAALSNARRLLFHLRRGDAALLLLVE